jgi:ABC-type polysaccharide/polyol phosphate transport system ATPase subunit
VTNPDTVARLVDVGKEYVKYIDTPTLLTGIIRVPSRTRRERLWAVRHVNLDVERGQSVGVIGRNGAGKSTTLGIFAGVTAPSEGTVSVRGRIAPLLRLGVGFHEELTGRENVYINGTVLGMSRKEIDKAFDDIVAFAELDRFVDTPVKFYSSGMLVRLGFASAVASSPDVLLVDEVLAVGDVAFQAKSFERMKELREAGASLVVVSHNLEAIRTMCERVLVLDAGSPVFEGGTNEAIGIYHGLLRVPAGTEDHRQGGVQITSFELFDEADAPTVFVESGTVGTFRGHVRFDSVAVEHPIFSFWIATESGQLLYQERTVDGATGSYPQGSDVTFEVRLPLALATGNYTAGFGVRWGRELFESVQSPQVTFSVTGRRLVRGMADLGAELSVHGSEPQHKGT